MAAWDKQLYTTVDKLVPANLRNLIDMEDVKELMKEQAILDIKQNPNAIVEFYLDALSDETNEFEGLVQEILNKLSK